MAWPDWRTIEMSLGKMAGWKAMLHAKPGIRRVTGEHVRNAPCFVLILLHSLSVVSLGRLEKLPRACQIGPGGSHYLSYSFYRFWGGLKRIAMGADWLLAVEKTRCGLSEGMAILVSQPTRNYTRGEH